MEFMRGPSQRITKNKYATCDRNLHDESVADLVENGHGVLLAGVLAVGAWTDKHERDHGRTASPRKAWRIADEPTKFTQHDQK